MTASLEHIHGLHYRLTTRIVFAEVEDVFGRELRRCGKSGESAADTRRRAGDQAWNQALEISRDQAFQSALGEHGLRVIGQPEFIWLEREPGHDFVFTAAFEVFPAIDISGLAEIEIDDPAAMITDIDVAQALNVLRSGHKRFTKVSRAARPGDRVTFDYEGTIAGTAFEGSARTGAFAVLGEADVLEPMESALIGRTARQVFDTPITFGPDYAQQSLRGQTAEFHISVQAVAAPELPELDPDLVKRLGVESGSLDELRAQVRQRLESECERLCARYQRRKLIDALIAAIPVAVPDILLSTELERVRASFANDSAAGLQEQPPEQPLQATAERRLTLSLILAEIIREQNIRLNLKRVEKKLDELSAGLALTDAKATRRQYRGDEQTMHNIQALVLEEQGFEAALESVRKRPVSMPFNALLETIE